MIRTFVKDLIRLLDLSGFDVGASLGSVVARDPALPGRPLRTPAGIQEDDDVHWNFAVSPERKPSRPEPASD